MHLNFSNFQNFRELVDLQTPPFVKRTDHTHGKSHFFLASHFSLEWNRQSAFKFDMDLDVLLIYRLIPRRFGLLHKLPILVPLQSVTFFKASCSVY
jgi:hypothetical protein